MRQTIPLMLAITAITAATGATAGSAGSAQTAAAPAGPRPPMRQDANRDGITTRAEAIAQADARFAQMDTDHDGRVSGGEMRAYRTALHDRMVASGRDVPVPPPGGRKNDGIGRQVDPDGDGSVTRAEFEARALKRFDRIDADHDGRIDATERANAPAMRQGSRRERREDVTPPAPAPAQ